MKYSIIVPVYNAEKCICNCLDSIYAQTIDDYEIILVNDGSVDLSKNKIEEYENINSVFAKKIRYIEQENKGPAAARAKGIEIAMGEYVAFLDADDIWYPNKLEYVDKVIEKEGATFIYHNENMVYPNGKKKQCDYYTISDNAVEDLIIKGNPISTSTVVVKANILKDYHTFSDGVEYGEDIACWIALAKGGAKFSYIDIPLGEYRRVETSLTLSNEKYLLDTGIRLLEFYDCLSDCGYSLEQINELKSVQISRNMYNMGRYYHRRGDFSLAKENYYESLRKKKSVKKLLGYLLSMMHIKF